MNDKTSNPYQPPHSQVTKAQGVEEYAEVKVLSFSGRIGRLRYIAYSFGMMSMVAIIGIVLAILVPALAESGNEEALNLVAGFIGLFMILLYVFVIVASIVFTIRRLNDFNVTGWLCLLTLVPIINIVFSFVLWFIPGTQGENQYGLPPKPNSGAVIFLSILLPIVIVFGGMLAAIAIPAYQTYVERAAEARSQ